MSFKNRKARIIRSARKHLEKPPKFRNQVHWRDKTKINFHRNIEKRKILRRKRTIHDQKPKPITGVSSDPSTAQIKTSRV